MPMSMGAPQEIDLSASSAGDVIDPKVVAQAITDNVETTEETTVSKTTLEGDAKIEVEEDGLQIQNEVKDEIIEDDNIDDKLTGDAPEEEEKKEKPESTVDDDTAEPETFKVLAQHFSDEGILEGFSEEMENTPEAFEEMITATVDKQINDYKESFVNPLSKQFLDYLEADGDPGRFMQLVSGPNYSQISDDALAGNEAVQKQVLRAYYTEQGENPEDIEETIQAFEDAGHLEKRSTLALGKLQTLQDNKMQAEMKQQAAAKQAQTEKVNEYIKTLETDIQGRDEIAGFQLTKKAKSDFFDYITKVDPKTGTTKLLSDSQDQEKQLMMSFFYYNNFKFDKLAKKERSKTAQSLAEKLGRHTDTSGKQKSRKKTPSPTSEGTANLSAMKSMFG